MACSKPNWLTTSDTQLLYHCPQWGLIYKRIQIGVFFQEILIHVLVRGAKLVDVWLLGGRPGKLDDGTRTIRLHVEPLLAAKIEAHYSN